MFLSKQLILKIWFLFYVCNYLTVKRSNFTSIIYFTTAGIMKKVVHLEMSSSMTQNILQLPVNSIGRIWIKFVSYTKIVPICPIGLTAAMPGWVAGIIVLFKTNSKMTWTVILTFLPSNSSFAITRKILCTCSIQICQIIPISIQSKYYFRKVLKKNRIRRKIFFISIFNYY